MSLTTGTLLGPYEILSAIGAGGMGEVYRAKDTRLDRTVALKIVTAALSGQPELRQRFNREARAISQLDHPNICALYDVGEQNGRAFLVMQFLDGETLGSRLLKGPLPLDEAIAVAIQIASGLDKAHRAGIIHRDLKPGNIMLTKGGSDSRGQAQAKLLDFGLAKVTPAAGGTNLSTLPTTPPSVTVDGAILGTFQYMAPEQLEGHDADVRSDIFAFGAIVYEMVTGRRPFSGKSHASLISSIMSSEPPPMAAAQPGVSPALERVVASCLAKDPDERWQSIRDVIRELQWAGTADAASRESASNVTGARAARRSRETVAWIAASVLALATIALSGRLLMRQPPADAPVQRFSLLPPADGTIDPNYLALSPDGRFLAFVAASSDGKSRLWIRAIDGLSSRSLDGTDDARYPFWSPDSRFVGFFAEQKMKNIRFDGGPVQIVCSARYGFGGTWNRDGVIVFSPDVGTVLYQVSADGGTPSPATSFDTTLKEGSHVAPFFLPDGKHFLYTAGRGIDVGTLGSTKGQRLVDADSRVQYAQPVNGGSVGYLLYVRDSTLLAQPFDATALKITGAAVPVADGEVQASTAGAAAPFTAAANGVLAYRSLTAKVQPTWFDRSGSRVGTLGQPARYNSVEISSDDKRVAVEQMGAHEQSTNIWLLGQDGEVTAVTFRGGLYPRWDRAGHVLTFLGPDDSVARLPIDGSAREEIIYRAPEGLRLGALSDSSPDGRTLTVRLLKNGLASGAGTVAAVPAGRAPASPLWEVNGFNARFSPDGKWLAYTSEDSGVAEVYVQPFPPTGAKWLISHGGGIRPRWRGDGRELFFIASGAINGFGRIMTASIETGAGFHAAAPVPIVTSPMTPRNANDYPYAVSADGQRILVLLPVDDPMRTPITIVLNWMSALKRN